MTDADFYGIALDGAQGTAASSTAALLEVFEILKPQPVATPLIRIGGDADGSYLVPDDLEGITTCFSPGVNRIKHFEDVLADRHGIRSHMCDFSTDVGALTTPLKPGLQTFVKKWLDVDGGEDSVSLEDWVHEHDPQGDLLLQMDIEGAEYRNLLATSDETLARFRIAVIEVHGLRRMLEAPVLREVVGPFFRRLATVFTTVRAHPNNCCGELTVPGTDVTVPGVLELTLLRKDHVVPAPGPVALPHPLDVSRNVPRNPPLFLSEAWCDHARPVESRLKILEDTLAYRDEVGGNDPGLAGALELTMQSVQTLRALVLPVGGREGLVEIAAGRPYALSSAYGTSSRTGLVASRSPYFFHTGFGRGESIRVDLGREHRVRRIEVTNRRGGYQARSRHLFALLEGQGSGAARQVFGMYERGQLPDGSWQEAGIDVPDVTARYVTITAPTSTALHFADLRVYAPAGDRSPAPTRPAWRRLLGSARRRARRLLDR